MKIAVLASGAGTTLEHLLKANRMGDLRVNIAILITDNEKAGAISVARNQGLKTQCLQPRDFKDFTTWDHALLEVIKTNQIEALVLLGFLKKIGPRVLAAFKNKIVNTHPSLLPKYGGKGMYGLKVHEAVIAAKDKVTGVTIHQVNENYDEGQILKQHYLDISPGESAASLEKRVKELEKAALVEFLNHWSLDNSRGE